MLAKLGQAQYSNPHSWFKLQRRCAEKGEAYGLMIKHVILKLFVADIYGIMESQVY